MATQSVRIGWRPYVNVVTQVVNAVDADAQAFIAAAGITNLTQAAAINTLVTDLKGYGIWTKMKAIYPMVGGTASSHKFNLKDPRDLDVAFRLAFSVTGWTHTSTGAKPNGTTGYADTKLNPSTNLTTNEGSLGFYSRTNNAGAYMCEIGAITTNPLPEVYFQIHVRFDNNYWYCLPNTSGTNVVATTSDSTGFYQGIRLNSTTVRQIKNTTFVDNINSYAAPNSNVLIGSRTQNGNWQHPYSNRECAFAYIGNSLTTTDATNFYTAVQKFQTTLGRQIGSPIVSDTDAQAFLNAAGITDLGQANAVNTLVVDLKAAGVWTKMKAVYPFVGGTAAQHRFNLKAPTTNTSDFYGTFNGGVTHSSTGVQFNGSTGYMETNLNENSVMTLGNEHISFYSRTNTSGLYVDMGVWDSVTGGTQIISRYTFPVTDSFIGYIDDVNSSYVANANSWGFYMANRTSTSQLKLQINSLISTFANNSSSKVNRTFWIGARNINSTAYLYSTRECAFATIGDGLSDTEAVNFYTAVQKYQTSLGRQIGTPVLASGQTAGLLDTYSSATVAYSLRKLRNGYYGFAIRVRRSSDNAEQDIAFKSDGTLDTTSLLAFVGSGNGFVTTWYDQSGNGYNAYQSTAINQPLIVSSGSLTTNGGKPAIRCAGSTGLLINQISLGTTHSMFAVIDWSGPYKEYFGSFGNSWAFYQVDGEYKASGVVGRTNAAFTTNRFLGTLLRVNTQLQYYQNSTTLGSAFTISSNNVFNLSNLIGEDYNWGFAGDQQEAIIYTSSMASSRTAIESNINSYYSIY